MQRVVAKLLCRPHRFPCRERNLLARVPGKPSAMPATFSCFLDYLARVPRSCECEPAFGNPRNGRSQCKREPPRPHAARRRHVRQLP